MTDRSRLSPQTLALPQMSNRLKVDQGLMIFSLANPKCTFLDLFFESFDCRRVEFYTICRRSSNTILFKPGGVRGPSSSIFFPSSVAGQDSTRCMHSCGLVAASLAHNFLASLDPVPPPLPAALTHTHTLPTRILHHTIFSISRLTHLKK